MKRIAILLLLVLTTGSVASAQYNDSKYHPFGPDEISLSYGRVSIPGTAYVLGGVFGTVFTLGAATPGKIASTGAVGFEYMHHFGKHFALGALATYENIVLRFDYATGETDADGKKILREGPTGFNHFISLMPALKFPWFCREHVSMYTKLGVGAMFNVTNEYTYNEDTSAWDRNTDTNWNWAVQASLVGVDFGGDICRGFVEGGFGMQGLVCAGVRFGF